jgi:hypothetical protein
MPLLQVRECPEEVYRDLVNVAKRENRSIAQQVIVLLRRSLGKASSNMQRRQDILEKIGTNASVLGVKNADFVSWIREDRER